MITLKLKTNDMNHDARDDDTDRPIAFNNESIPDNAVFAGAALTRTTAGAASIIVIDAHIPPPGQKQHINPFPSSKMKKMAKKDIIDTTPAPAAPKCRPVDASA